MEKRSQIFEKWKTTSIFSKLEDDLIYFGKWKMTLIQGKLKTTKKIQKRKTTSKISKMEEDLKNLKNGRQPEFQMEDKKSLFLIL